MYMCKSEPVRAAVVATVGRVESLCVSECTNEYSVCVCVTEGGLW